MKRNITPPDLELNIEIIDEMINESPLRGATRNFSKAFKYRLILMVTQISYFIVSTCAITTKLGRHSDIVHTSI